MLGTIVNTTTIVVGSIAGACLNKGLNEKYQSALFNVCGLVACGVGINAIIKNMPNSQYPVLFIISLAIGSLIGTALNLDERFQSLVNKRSKNEGTNLGKGLSSGILIYCIGSLSIMGPIMSALHGDNTFLFTNATLDLITSMVLASTYGIGMILAAPVLFCWQGSIYLVTKLSAGSFLTDPLICEMCIVGGFLIAASGIGILNIKNMKTLNMLPSLFIPVIFFLIKGIIGF